MTNLLALCLVLTSLAAAGVWTPTPEKQKQGEDVIVKEGLRTVVVEYDEQDGQPNTIVSISPEQHRAPYKPEFSTHAEGGIPSSASGMVEKAKEKIKEASSSLPNLGQGVSQSSEESERESHASSKELICDALGKCKHKIASAMGKTKEIVSESAQEAIDRTKEKAHEAEEEAKQTAREVISKPKEKAQDLGDAAAHAFGKAKETLSRKAQEVQEYAKESVEDAMGKVKEAKDTGTKIGEHIATNLSEKMETAKEEVAEKTKEAKETAERAAEKLKKQSKMGMSGILERGRDVGHDALKYVKSLEAMRSLMFVLNLLGLATAYGMCVWVTFISSYILAAAMSRHKFGIVQSKIYPVYFSAMAASIGATLVGLVLGNTRRPVQLRKAEILQAYFLLSSLLMVLVNMLYLEPRATKVMFERIKVEKEEGREREELTTEPSRASEPKPDAEPAASITTSAPTAAPAEPPPRGAEQEVIRIRIVRLNDRLKKLNTYSSLLNILTLMTLSWHLVYLSQRLHLMC